MGESRNNESGPPAAGRAWLTRRGFLTGVVGVGAVVGLARATEGPLWHQDAFAATAPSGPPTMTLPLPTTTAPEQLFLTLAQARRDRGVDMIVVFTHQCAMSTSVPGNGSDPGIRRAWLPLFDRYQVDLVLSGHEHEHERSYPFRGYDRGAHGTVVSPNPGQTAGGTIDTRRPCVATTETVSYYGVPAWDTSQGTVFLVLGGGGTNGPSNVYGTDDAGGLPQAKVISERNAITGSQATGFKRNAADSIEDAPWSAATNAGDAYGYAVFDVDPGVRPGGTTITMKYFAIPP